MEPKFIEMAKTIFLSIDHYRESGRDDKFNIDSIAEYLQRQFLLQQCSVNISVPLTQTPEYLKGWEDGIYYERNTKPFGNDG